MRERSIGPVPRCVNLPLVHELVDGVLDPAGVRRLEAHLAVCAACTEEGRFVRALKEDAAGLPRIVPGDHVWEAIGASIATGASAGAANGDAGAANGDAGAANGDAGVADTDAAANDADGLAAGAFRRFRARRMGGLAAAVVPIVGVAILAGTIARDRAGRGPGSAGERAETGVAEGGTWLQQPSGGSTAGDATASSTTETAPAERPERVTGARSGLASVRPAAAGASKAAGETDGSIAHASGGGQGGLDLYGTALALENASPVTATPAEVDSGVALERERLAEAESAIRACNDALEKNPDDVRVRAALLAAYDRKVRALRALVAAEQGRRPSVTATPAGYGGARP